MSHAEHVEDEVPPRIEGGEPLSPQELLQFPFFKGVSEKLLEKNPGAAVRRRFKKGEIICKEGEQGSTAFYILEGKVDVFINATVSHASTHAETKGSWFKKITSKLVSSPKELLKADNHHYIPIDASVDLSLDNPIALLTQGDLFGEMTCVS